MNAARILKFFLPIWCAATPALAADPWMSRSRSTSGTTSCQRKARAARLDCC